MAIASRKTGKYNCIFFFPIINQYTHTLLLLGISSPSEKLKCPRIAQNSSNVYVSRTHCVDSNCVDIKWIYTPIHPFYCALWNRTPETISPCQHCCVFCPAFIYSTHSAHGIRIWIVNIFKRTCTLYTTHMRTVHYTMFKTNLLSVSLNRIQRPLYHNKSEQWACSHGANRMHLSNS